MKLGKKPKKTDRRTLQLARYLPRLPPPPAFIDHASKLPADIGMMGNDTYGDCAVAAPGHMRQSWTVYGDGIMVTTSDTDILAAYFKLSPNDDGCYMLDVLNYWRSTGIGSDRCEAFVEAGTAELVQAKLCIEYFGSQYIGMALPDTNTFGPWNVVNPTWPANPYNGHAVCLIGYDDLHQMFKVATWGEVWDMSYSWYQKYTDECYAVLNDIMLIQATGKSPEGFNWTALQDDLDHIGDPIVDPTPTPPPTPDPTTGPTGPMTITAQDQAYWYVYMDGEQQVPAHNQQFEAAQHADALRWAKPGHKIEIRHAGVYLVN